ncbi:cytochrome P450 714C2-like [Pistacia vera]|uniref:cytochrome P450 714C2-like n=1 Tax=Pistacia vera TaxID=55513 RepID=UPI0012632674|nr:cytochrome P450 714C2-like [Pistacia vera]
MVLELSLMGKMILSVVVGGLVGLFLYLYNVMLLKPKILRSKLTKQGIRGPSPSFLLANIPEMKKIQLQVISEQQNKAALSLPHNWPSTVFPFFEKWTNEYGPMFLYSTGNMQMIYVADVEMVKELSLCTSLSLGKPSYLTKERGPILGHGLISSSGLLWAHQRKIIAPEFYLDKVKGMVNLMVDSTTSLIGVWERIIESEGGTAEIRVDMDMRSLAADIISRACFGSNYSEGQEIFSGLRSLQKIMSKGMVGVPGLRYLPTKSNREIWKLEKEINSMILRVVKQRLEASSEKDLLQMILQVAKSNNDESGLTSQISQDKFIVDNCKSIYFAGHETSAITASWVLLLLGAHPEWQDRARSELLKICRNGLPDADMLPSLKVLTMVIQETLRLYPPVGFIPREALQDIKFKDIVIPKGMGIHIPVAMLQQNPDLWGPDAHQFKPERFANGISAACKTPQAYLPFGMGPRICAGQHFAIAELRVILSLILSKFCFSLSPKYSHSPVYNLVVEPKYGVSLYVRKV